MRFYIGGYFLLGMSLPGVVVIYPCFRGACCFYHQPWWTYAVAKMCTRVFR